MKKTKYLVAVLLTCVFLNTGYGSSGREILSLNGKWRFCVDSMSAGDRNNWGVYGLPDSLVRTVTVPHAWNADHGLEKYWGKCWYQRTFEISADQLLKTVRLQFDAVYHDAVIYINGIKAGEHIGSGYNRFYITITEWLKEGANTVTVEVDNSPSRSNIPFLKSFDWANDGGIYRNVYLVATQAQAIRNIHVIALPEGKKGTARIRISFIDTVGVGWPRTKLYGIIAEENQETHAEIFRGELPGKFENGSFFSLLKFDSINPWHFDSPNLYKITLKIMADGIEQDELSTTFGFRSIRVEDNRYILNGEPVRLMGVEWMPGSSLERGMAETTSDFENNLKLMKGANCIFTRFHWQQDEYIFDWCDRHGMLVQEEIPYWGGVTNINDTLLSRGIQHLNEMMDNHYNHPSIIAWGIGNELASHQPSNIEALQKLYRHAKSMDSSRLVNYVTNNLHWGYPGEGKELPDATSDFDMMMFNEYFSTWYGKSLQVVSGELDRIAREYPGKPLTISEWGVCEPVHKGGDLRRREEMMQQSTIYGSKEYVAGAIYFCLNDYRTHMGEDFTYSYPQRVHGVCDIFLKPKPSYDTLKSISSPVLIRSLVAKEGLVTLTLAGKTGLPCYTVRNYTVVAGENSVVLRELKPGEVTTLTIRTDAREIALLRPTGFEVWRVSLK
jgi:beta-galactosidase